MHRVSPHLLARPHVPREQPAPGPFFPPSPSPLHTHQIAAAANRSIQHSVLAGPARPRDGGNYPGRAGPTPSNLHALPQEGNVGLAPVSMAISSRQKAEPIGWSLKSGNIQFTVLFPWKSSPKRIYVERNLSTVMVAAKPSPLVGRL